MSQKYHFAKLLFLCGKLVDKICGKCGKLKMDNKTGLFLVRMGYMNSIGYREVKTAKLAILTVLEGVRID